MIATSHHTSTRRNVAPSLGVKVIDKIALFEQQSYIADTSTCKSYQPHKTIVNGHGSTVHIFLHSIGEDAPQTLPPKLWRWASHWKKRVQKRVDQRQQDTHFYSLSETLDTLDAILYADCTSLEIETLNLLACKSSTDENALVDYYDDRGSISSEEDSGDSTQLPALESGIVELAEELEIFNR